MSSFLQEYKDLSSSSPRADVAKVLQSIISASPLSIGPSPRQELIQLLIDDVKACTGIIGKKGRLIPTDAAQALLATKILGKMPAGSEIIATPANLSTLLALSSSLKNDNDASSEALRCVANALLLIDTARVTWVDKKVGGGEASVEMLEKATTPDQIFLASRMLFLCTASMAHASDFIQAIVEKKQSGCQGMIVDIIGAKLDFLTSSIVSGAKMGREAMTDTLKLTFNIVVHYPKIVEDEVQDLNFKLVEGEEKVMGDYWSPKLSSILPPLLRAFNTLPPFSPSPLASPLAEVIHCLMTIPVSPPLRSVWFGTPSSATPTRSHSPSDTPPQGSKPPSPVASGSELIRASTAKERPGPMDRALSAISAGRRSLSRSGSQSPPVLAKYDTLLRVFDLLEVSMSHYLPGTVDPDNSSVRERCQEEGSTLDDVVTPLVVLMTRFVIADEAARKRVGEWLLPAELDRTKPLESRSDLLGRCLRLLASVHNARVKDAVGEMLFGLCDSDATTLSAQVGYGNVAGFLFNKGIMNAPIHPSNATLLTPNGETINPITGTIQGDSISSTNEMTEEEKETEAEKLFVLFDRLERTGALPANRNPIRKAIQEGKIQM